MGPVRTILAVGLALAACGSDQALTFVVPLEQYRMAVLALRSGAAISVTVLDQAALDAGFTAEVSREGAEAVVLLYVEPPAEPKLKPGKLRPAQSRAEGGLKLPPATAVFLADQSSGTRTWQKGEVPAWLAELRFPELTNTCPTLTEVGTIELPASEVKGVQFLARLSNGRILIVADQSTSVPPVTRIYTLTPSSALERSAYVLTASVSYQATTGFRFSGFGELDGGGWLASNLGKLYPIDLETGRIGEASTLQLGLVRTTITAAPSGLLAVSGNGCFAHLSSGEGTWTLLPGTEGLCQPELPHQSDDRRPPQAIFASATTILATGWSHEHANQVLRIEGEKVTFECFDSPRVSVVESISPGGDGAFRGYAKLDAAKRALFRYTSEGACPWKHVLDLPQLVSLTARLLPYPKGKGVVFASAHGNVGVIEDDYFCKMLPVSGSDPNDWAGLESIVPLDAQHYLTASTERRVLWIVRID